MIRSALIPARDHVLRFTSGSNAETRSTLLAIFPKIQSLDVILFQFVMNLIVAASALQCKRIRLVSFECPFSFLHFSGICNIGSLPPAFDWGKGSGRNVSYVWGKGNPLGVDLAYSLEPGWSEASSLGLQDLR